MNRCWRRYSLRPPAFGKPCRGAAAAYLGGTLVLGVGAWTVWSQFTRPGIVHRVDQSADLFTTSENPARDGGTAQAFLSRDQNSGYVTVSGMPQLPDGQAYQVWLYPDDGTATLTHYTLPDGYIASCGCTGASTQYPTAAMSQYAYGSSTAYGPACGRCFKITLLNSYMGTPPLFPNVTKSVVVKVTDLCPVGGAGWCSATPDKPNQ